MNSTTSSLRRAALCAAAGVLICACVTVPPGPSVMVLPGTHKGFAQFQADDAICRDWAAAQVGTAPRQAAAQGAVESAAIATAIGAAAGTAIGAAAGDTGAGAAIGAGSGLLMGSAVGTDAAWGAAGEVQHRYDVAYMQCMYAQGNQIPVASGAVSAYGPPPGSAFPPRSAPPRTLKRPRDVPPPPRGEPPPPPPDVD